MKLKEILAAQKNEGEMSEQDKSFFKRLNKKVVAAMVIAAVLLTTIIGATVIKNVKAGNTELPEILTVQAAKQDIQKTISATGTIISSEESSENASITGSYPVAEVYVKVGDVVKKGDPLYKLDMNSMKEQLSYQQQALSIQNQLDDISRQNAERGMQSTKDSGAIAVIDADRDIARKQQAVVEAERNVKKAKEAIDRAYDSVRHAEEGDSEEEKRSAHAERIEAENALQPAKDALEEAKRDLELEIIKTDKAKKDANDAIIDKYMASKVDELNAKQRSLSAKQEMSKAKEELSKEIVYASQDGTVTNVNIKAGQPFSGGDAVVIDNVTNLKATADIDEAQIPNVKEGQKVQIKTDATGDEILKGTVVFVSPTATKNSNKNTDNQSSTASVSKTRATYRVDVDLEGSNEALRLGMTAKMTFIIADKQNALAVPSADIQTDADGSKYVVVQQADGTTTNVKVETGISDEFYTEITGGQLKEGQEIVEASMDGGADVVLDAMGADGGIYDE
ncbi:Multidrug resistance efflux pump [Pseudobutyrivibrio sp. 49]|uniref:efflux RND transporter periplasmic adaptor subunit n=1 Tax=Pseudobutyrivibrio sp. 49 TaxID=1855344 RepID=UPI0008820D53|nr:efflux RND transporter periplasmic adaptor subunit [Pseudobutyrivibrio sp. 49]SDI12061.1 Multidrug resistance efflux pump [Pseudobutyrivibrio sp. 49]